MKIEIGAYQKTYVEDSIPASDDLTELKVDTLTVYEPAIWVNRMVNEQKDSLIFEINNALSATVLDTTIANIYMARMSTRDSLEVQNTVNIYHNDRTTAQAEAVKESLIEAGIEELRIQTVGYKDDLPSLEFPGESDRMIVIRLLNGPQN